MRIPLLPLVVKDMNTNYYSIGTVLAAIVLVTLAVSQVYRPWFSHPRGAVVRDFRLPLTARLRLHSFWLAGVALLYVAAATPQVEIGVLPLAIVSGGMVALVAIPVRYTISEEGIQVGRTPVRRWTEFAGLSARNGWIHLKPVAGASGLIVRSPGGRDGELLLGELRGLFRLSYKGESGRAIDGDAPMAADAAIEVSVA